MIPYADFTYFGVLLYVVIPATILRVTGRTLRPWIVGATLIMLGGIIVTVIWG